MLSHTVLAFSLLSSVAATAAATPPVPDAAQGLGPGLHIHLEQDVDAPADATWRALADDYVGVADWTTTVADSWVMAEADVPEGLTAHADAPVIGRMVKGKLGVLSETLVEFDDGGRTFTFQAGGLPRMLAYSQNTQRVAELPDGRSRITFDIYVVPNLPKMMHSKIDKRFRKKMAAILVEFRDHIEAAQPE